MAPATTEHDPFLDNLTGDWDFSLNRVREALTEEFSPTDWAGPWTELFKAHHAMTSTPWHDRPLTAGQQQAQQSARGQLLLMRTDWVRANGPLSAAQLSKDTTGVPGPVLRRLIGLSAADRSAPLERVSDGRPDRWVILDGQNLATCLNVHRTGLGYWVAVTVPAVLEQSSRWGLISVHRVSALVADILTRQHSSTEVEAAVVRRGDTAEMLNTALRLWSAHRYSLTPLGEWPKAVKTARHIGS